jgi:hypothetical protein
MVLHAEEEHLQISTRGLYPGVYLMHIRDEATGASLIRRLVIQ